MFVLCMNEFALARIRSHCVQNDIFVQDKKREYAHCISYSLELYLFLNECNESMCSHIPTKNDIAYTIFGKKERKKVQE